MNISERQQKILFTIIEEYMKSAEAVGSVSLVRNNDLGVSSATVRNEMVRLMESGFLEKDHVSSGRLPTDLAIRFYVDRIVNRDKLPQVKLVKLKQGIFKERFDEKRLLNSILQLLSEHCNTPSFVLLDDMTRHYGVNSIFNYEELKNVEALQRILDLLEDEHLLKKVFSKYAGDDVKVLIGEELGIRNLEDCTMVFTRFNYWGGKSGHMGVIGSRRLDYKHVIPTVNHVANAVDKSLQGWNK